MWNIKISFSRNSKNYELKFKDIMINLRNKKSILKSK